MTASTPSSSPARARPSSPAPTSPNSASRRSSRRSDVVDAIEKQQAGGRGDPRHRARRRARGGARLPLPRRRCRGEVGTARGQAGPPAGRRRHPAAAARRRVRKALEMIVIGERRSARRRLRCGLVDRLVEGDLIPHAVAYAEEVRDVRPLPKLRAAGQDRRVRPGDLRPFPKANAQVPRLRGAEATSSAVQAAASKPSPKASTKSASCSWS